VEHLPSLPRMRRVAVGIDRSLATVAS